MPLWPRRIYPPGEASSNASSYPHFLLHFFPSVAPSYCHCKKQHKGSLNSLFRRSPRFVSQFFLPWTSLHPPPCLSHQALYGSCGSKKGESLAVWTLKGTSYSDNGTRVVCQQPNNPAAPAAVLQVYGEDTTNAIWYLYYFSRFIIKEGPRHSSGKHSSNTFNQIARCISKHKDNVCTC